MQAKLFMLVNIITEQDDEELKFYRKAVHTPAIITKDIIGHLDKEPCKCLAISLEDKELMKTFSNSIQEEFGDKITVMTSTPNYVEMIPPNSGKGFSVEWLCNYLQIPISNSLAAGDEMNDVTMIEAAGIGIVMKNGRDYVKKIADITTEKDNNNDGLVPVLQKYL